MRIAALVMVFFALPASAAKPTTSLEAAFLAGQVAAMKGQGYSVKKKLLAPSSDGGKLAIYMFKDAAGQYDTLRVWHLKGKVARLIYREPSSSFRLELERIHDRGRLPALYHDGRPTLAFVSHGGGVKTLHLVRFSAHTPQVEETPLPEASLRDVEGNGTLQVVSRSLPLGRLYEIECGDFHTRAAQNAWKTVIYDFKDGRLVAASAHHARWFNAHLAQLEGDIASMDPRATKRYGEFLGASLAIYFDHAEKGTPRQGWGRFTELFRAGEGDPAGTSDCLNQVKIDLRGKLGIPDSWE